MFSLEEKYNRTFTEKQLLGNVLMYAEEKKVSDLNREWESTNKKSKSLEHYPCKQI